MRPFLIAIRGPLRGHTFIIASDTLRIGRGPDSDVNIPDVHVSQMHAILTAEKDAFTLTDQASFNGTFVNGEKVSSIELAHADRIEVGISEFSFLMDPPILHLEDLDFAGASQKTVRLPSGSVTYPIAVSSNDQQLGRSAADLQMLLDLNQKISSLKNSKDIQDAVLDSVLAVVPAEKAAILISDDDQENFIGHFVKHRDGTGADTFVSKTVCRRVLRTGNAELINGINSLPEASISQLNFGASSVICVALKGFDTRIGVIHIDTTDPDVNFDERHLQLVLAIVSIGGIALEHAHYVEWLESESEILASSAVHVVEGIVGESATIKDLQRSIAQYAPSTAPVLIEGETGTGKEIVARAMHANSRRKNAAWIDINCAILREERAESALFGHERGSFTDARSRYQGCFERANGGTLFLDEIGDLSLDVQKMLLRALQEKTICRMGGIQSIPVDVRIIAATNRDLRKMMMDGTFRRDVYERLCVIHITIPPLRERKDDIPALAYHFLRKYSLKENREILGFTSAALRRLREYSWPHNIRELENCIWRAVLHAKSDRIDATDLPNDITASSKLSDTGRSLDEVVCAAKKAAVVDALRESAGSIKEAAKILEIQPNSLSRLVSEFGLKRKTESAD